jgi:hypothetical protein
MIVASKVIAPSATEVALALVKPMMIVPLALTLAHAIPTPFGNADLGLRITLPFAVAPVTPVTVAVVVVRLVTVKELTAILVLIILFSTELVEEAPNLKVPFTSRLAFGVLVNMPTFTLLLPNTNALDWLVEAP